LLFVHGVAVLGCGSTPPSSSSPAASDPTAAPVSPEPVSPARGRERVRLELGKPQTLNGVEVVLSVYEVERIEGDPEGHYPSGIGVSLHIRVAGEEIVLSELPDGYESARTATTATHRVELVAHGSNAGAWVEIDLAPNAPP
jgi:hypothetical protein